MNELIEKVQMGRALDDIMIIDSHIHMGHLPNFHMPCHTAESIVEIMRRIGINRSIVSASLAIGADYQYGNTLVMQAMDCFPEQLLGLVVLNPHFPQEMEQEIRRCFKHSGMKGLKVHAGFHKSNIDNENYALVYETAVQKNCPVLIHTWGIADIMAVAKIAQRYKGIHIIMGHGGADENGMREAVKLIQKYDTIYLDTALSSCPQGNIEWLVKEIGASKIMFGTDMPLFDPSMTLGRIVLADISEQDKRNILGLNMKNLLGL